MPLFMLRSSPIWIVVASLGSIMPVARAQDPPCPSQIVPGGVTAGADTIRDSDAAVAVASKPEAGHLPEHPRNAIEMFEMSDPILRHG